MTDSTAERKGQVGKELFLLFRDTQSDEAFNALVQSYWHRLCGLACFYGLDSAEAEDVVQEALFAIVEKAGSFDADLQFEPWLFTVVKNKALDALRRAGRRPQSIAAELLASIPVAPCKTDPEELEQIQAAIRQLPQRQRFAFEHMLVGMRHSQIAQELEISVWAARKLLERARDNLSRLLDDERTGDSV